MNMFRSMSSEQHFNSKGASESQAVPTTGLEGANMADRHGSWDGKWTNMLSVVSRPAWSLIQKYLPGWTQTPALAARWDGEEGSSGFALESSLVAGLGDLGSAAQIATRVNVPYLRCAKGGKGEHLRSWLSAESLGELGIQHGPITEVTGSHAESEGRLTAARNCISQVVCNLASAHAQSRHAVRTHHPQVEVWFAGSEAVTRSGSEDGFWGEEEPANSLTRGREWQLCEEHHSVGHCHEDGSPASTATSMDEESAGASTDKGGLHVARPESLPNPSQQLPSSSSAAAAHHQHHSVVEHPVSTRAVAACSEVTVLTPDQDNGYSSLEEENANAKQHGMKLMDEKQGSDSEGSAPAQRSDDGNVGEAEETTGGDGMSEAARIEEEEEEEEQKEEASESKPADETSPSTPGCQNKAIAYIMGSPCSDESESEDDSDDWDSNDDDGFDSEGSSHLLDSEDEDDSDDDEEDSDADEVESESERLWNSLCQSEDPYNPQNFTAPLRTTTKSHTPGPDASPSGSPVEPSLSPLSSPSPLMIPREEESSEEVCSMDEAECAKLLNSFSCSSDPYNPLNFQAPIRTREPAKGRCKKKAGVPVGPPVYKKEEAEERLDSGFSEAVPVHGPGSGRCVRLKKVRFVEEVEEFYASGDEDRCGPWEEFARDRCRFQRRVQEVEESISYCFNPSFRLLAFHRINHTS